MINTETCPVCESTLIKSDNFIFFDKEYENSKCTSCNWSYESEFKNDNDM